MSIESSSSISDDQLAEFQALQAKINAMLPPRYQGCFEDVPPSSMGSASSKSTPMGSWLGEKSGRRFVTWPSPAGRPIAARCSKR